MIDCRHRGGTVPTENGPEHLCAQFGRCVETPSGKMQLCSIECPKYVSIRDRGPCLWRGNVIREDVSNLCGIRGQTASIYQCDMHGECALGRYCHSQTVRACLHCADWDSSIPVDRPRPNLTMRCRQDYSTARGSSDESTTLSKLSSNTKRHLIYHIWPKSGTGSWRWNVQQLLNRIDLFTGTRSIGISVGSDADDVDAVKSAFSGTRIDHWIVRDNDPSRGEGTTFRAMLSTLPIDGITFYAHAKGVRYNPMAPAIRKWVELMYRVNIDDWPTASRALDDFPIVGAFKQHFHVVKRRDCHNWHFAGTFFWMRNEEVFRRPEWRELVGGYYAVELWPGRLFHSTEAFCLFGEDLLDPYSEIEMNRWEAFFSVEQSRS